jgi:hypothetical protein
LGDNSVLVYCGIHKIRGRMMSFSSCRIGFGGRGIRFRRRGIKHQTCIMNCSQSNSPIGELMVSKASPDQSLADGNTTQHLPPHGVMRNRLRHFYSGSRAYKGDCGSRLALSWLHHLEEARAPLKNKKKHKKPTTLSIVNS